jgi:hypothetical protein
VEQLMGWGRQGDLIQLPRMRTQLVASRTVGEALAHLAVSPVPTAIVGVSNPDDPDAVLGETGGLLPGPNATLAGPTFEEWLDARA